MFFNTLATQTAPRLNAIQRTTWIILAALVIGFGTGCGDDHTDHTGHDHDEKKPAASQPAK